MNLRYWSWFIVSFAILIHILGIYWLIALALLLFCFICGVCCIIYTQHSSESEFLKAHFSEGPQDPLNRPRALGLKLGCNNESTNLISPDIRVQIGRTKAQSSSKENVAVDVPKKSVLHSGIELFFKKNTKTLKETFGNINDSNNKCRVEITTVPGAVASDVRSVSGASGVTDEKKWNPFESIKIYTERKRSHEVPAIPSVKAADLAEECLLATPPPPSPLPLYKLHTDSAILDAHGTPKNKVQAILSGHKQVDLLLHTIIDYILRDFIESWFASLSNNKEFSEFRSRNCIEESVKNICARIKNTQWIPLMTTKLVDCVALHARYYRLANGTVNLELDSSNDEKSPAHQSPQRFGEKSSPQRRPSVRKKLQHRRNKSDTDLSWYIANQTIQKNVANSKFYTVETETTATGTTLTIQEKQIDPEVKLEQAFFNQCDLYENECLNEEALEEHLTHCMESVLYYTLPEEDFACIPLRIFLSTLLANVVFKPLLDMLSDPDFINLQIARLCTKEPPAAEIFLKLIRQCDDLSELRACRQLITKEMDMKFKDPNCAAELNSLKYTQKLIDLRISFLQNNKLEMTKDERDNKPMANLPILSLDELLNKELALSYYLDYLSILNLQKYVIFYLTAREWKATANRCLSELKSGKLKGSRDETLKMLREKAANISKEYLNASSTNFLHIDLGLIETINIRLKDQTMLPDSTWFDSICKYVYEKLKNEDIFLTNFYQSSAYRKLLLELEFCSNLTAETDLESHISSASSSSYSHFDTGSDSNSGDIQFDDDMDLDIDIANAAPSTIVDGTTVYIPSLQTTLPKLNQSQLTRPQQQQQQQQQQQPQNKSDNKHLQTETLIGQTLDLSFLPIANNVHAKLLDVNTPHTKHYRSHSDCTGIVQNDNEIKITTFQHISSKGATLANDNRLKISPIKSAGDIERVNHANQLSNSSNSLKDAGESVNSGSSNKFHQRLSAKIINTAINCEGQFAVYAIHVTVIEDNQQKSWHVYRRYSRFLDLKKCLVKRYPSIAHIPFPAKKAFQNTQRSVLEHRMTVLNEFLKVICTRADDNEDLYMVLRDFLEPDTNDKKIHGGAVIRTIETIVNPLKSGMRTIKNMPDTLVGGMAKILLGKGPVKETAFLDVTPIHLEHSSEYPALTSALNLLDEIFDLQARSQWLRRGLINRLLGAPWVSQTANRRIIQAAKSLIETDKIELLLSNVLHSIWPDGKLSTNFLPREESTKLRTRMAAKMSLFALLSDDLKHVVGSETTRYGLLNSFSMWQHKTLNLRLALVLFDEILKNLYQTDSMTKHIEKKT